MPEFSNLVALHANTLLVHLPGPRERAASSATNTKDACAEVRGFCCAVYLQRYLDEARNGSSGVKATPQLGLVPERGRCDDHANLSRRLRALPSEVPRQQQYHEKKTGTEREARTASSSCLSCVSHA